MTNLNLIISLVQLLGCLGLEIRTKYGFGGFDDIAYRCFSVCLLSNAVLSSILSSFSRIRQEEVTDRDLVFKELYRRDFETFGPIEIRIFLWYCCEDVK